ncbi:MAG: preprotein translocase subunit YajC [Nitrospinota bacterium]|jgi:preprotein translocase subunit YajC
MVSEAFAMPPPQSGGGGSGSLFISFIPILVMFAIFYLLLIRPQAKKQKEHKVMLASIKEGDNVLTTGGIYGTIIKIKDDIITLQIADNVKIKVSRGYIAAMKGQED